MSEYIKKSDIEEFLRCKEYDSCTWRNCSDCNRTRCIDMYNLSKLPTYSFPDREKGEWIHISERLPKPYEQVLRTVKSIGWNGTSHIHVDLGSICPIDTDVIAWMPLPEPYNADMRKTETCNGCTHPCVMYEPTMKACEKKGW